MKKQILLKQALLIVALAVFSVGCAKSKSKNPAPTNNGGVVDPGGTPPTTPPGDPDANRGSDWQSGGTAALTPDSFAAWNAYVATHPLNNPTDLRISVKMEHAGNGAYVGRLYISYYDNGQYYTGRFFAENKTVPAGVSNGHTGKSYGAYNRWFTWGGKNVFHAFLQDPYGGVMIVIDDSLDLGDGSGATELAGEIWFKNFEGSYAPQGQIPCWFIEIGPYDCRTFLTSGNSGYGVLNTTSALYPTQSLFYPTGSKTTVAEEPARGWRRLGKFTGLNRARAFSE